MIKTKSRKKITIIFIVLILLVLACLGASVLKTNAYNNKEHHALFEGEELFSQEDDTSIPVDVKAVPRDSTWTKAFDFNNEGLTEHKWSYC